jgi:hypothetical protein
MFNFYTCNPDLATNVNADPCGIADHGPDPQQCCGTGTGTGTVGTVTF